MLAVSISIFQTVVYGAGDAGENIQIYLASSVVFDLFFLQLFYNCCLKCFCT